MKPRTRLVLFLVIIALGGAVVAFLIGLRRPQLYRVTVLPSLGGEFIFPDAINDLGHIVGSSTVVGGGRHLFLWDRANGIRDLGPIDGPADINNEGQIAGTMMDPNGERRAFIVTPGGMRHVLGTLGGSTSIAMAISNRGQVVGESWTGAGMNHAFLWDEAQGMRDLSPPGTNQSHAYAINDRGQVMVFSPQLRVSLWDPNEGFIGRKIQMLGATFGGINNKGHAVFARRLPTGKSRLMISEAGSGWKTLYECEGNIGEVKVNDADQVLFAETRLSRFRLLNRLLMHRLKKTGLWDPQRGVISLDSFVPREPDESFIARNLNNKGDVVGVLISRDAKRHRAVLLEPIPERWGR